MEHRARGSTRWGEQATNRKAREAERLIRDWGWEVGGAEGGVGGMSFQNMSLDLFSLTRLHMLLLTTPPVKPPYYEFKGLILLQSF